MQDSVMRTNQELAIRHPAHHDMTPNTNAVNAIATAPTTRFVCAEIAPLPLPPAALPVDDGADCVLVWVTVLFELVVPGAPELVVVGSPSVAVVALELVETFESLVVDETETETETEVEPVLLADGVAAPPR